VDFNISLQLVSTNILNFFCQLPIARCLLHLASSHIHGIFVATIVADA